MSIINDIRGAEDLLAATVRVPDSVVYRAFVHETVILNLETGRYHGVNAIGGAMLDTLTRVRSVAAAAEILARDYGRPLAEIESDLCEFCDSLIERGLLIRDHI